MPCEAAPNDHVDQLVKALNILEEVVSVARLIQDQLNFHLNLGGLTYYFYVFMNFP
jgi:hypothetical protein